ncbi:type II toxin-antitoxin system HicB family antitoxin [Candidatus Peribacteria bacterium]|nr:type II toxin-antitoxin system HicB family antitoxin [Candidatus Peribacteria bacterium]
MHTPLTLAYTSSDGWIVATIPEVPGVITQGKTLEEVRENITEALEMMLSGNRAQFEWDTDSPIEQELFGTVSV